MTESRPIEERITTWLEAEAPADLPHYVLDAAFERTRTIGQDAPRVPRGLRARPSGRRMTMLLVAAAFSAVAGGLVAVGGGGFRLPPPATAQPATLLDTIRQTGSVRIAVRPDHPQARAGSAAVGFDTDIAAELARRLGARPDIVIVDETTMLGTIGPAWDLALPSTADWRIDTSRFELSTPYYSWPHRLIVPARSTATTIADLAGPICAVAGDPSESWLRGGYGGTSSSPLPIGSITRQTDADCLAALSAGDALAVLTAHLSDADLQVVGDVRVIGGPDAEPRSALVRRQSGTQPNPGDLLTRIDDALVAMRADGTLRRLSESRFGGSDYTTP